MRSLSSEGHFVPAVIFVITTANSFLKKKVTLTFTKGILSCSFEELVDLLEL